MTKLKLGKRIIEITHENKIYFPKDKITKKDVIEYYKKIGPTMITYTKNRPITMHRFPGGITHEGFYHKNAPDFFPKWIKLKKIARKEEKGSVNYVVLNDIATLIYIVNFGCLTPHLWLSKLDKLNYPDRMIFDFDPPSSKYFGLLCKKANELKIILQELGLHPLVMSTGSKGLHVTTPIVRDFTFSQVRTFAQSVAQILIDRDPKNLTLNVRKTERTKKIFVDTLRNSFGATGVAPYAIRAINGAPIACPLKWDELESKNLNPQKYNISNIFDRLKKTNDPWEDFDGYSASIKKANTLLKKSIF
jgi:bifunctional non-homologous end joining protein LigD